MVTAGTGARLLVHAQAHKTANGQAQAELAACNTLGKQTKAAFPSHTGCSESHSCVLARETLAFVVLRQPVAIKQLVDITDLTWPSTGL